MRTDLLKASEREFFGIYPGGFEHPDMVALRKKHKLDKMHEQTIEVFKEESFSFKDEVLENMVKIISRSSMVSMFEKPKFKDFAKTLDENDKGLLVQGLYDLLYDQKEKGFNTMVEVLKKGKLAKWSLITIIPYYYSPEEEVFVKPTTTKNVIKTFELEGLVYKPQPSYEFYVNYKEAIKVMKDVVDDKLAPNNGAFTGFLMMMMDKQ